jgi:phospholipase C
MTMPVDKVVVLMLENRSFDHMLGWLKVEDPASPVDGLTGNETNPYSGGTERVGTGAQDYTWIDPGHEYEDVVMQLFGGTTVPTPPQATNMGFVNSLSRKYGNDLLYGRTAMQCFDRARLPVLYALADHFTVCDRWFCSVPGPTWPNRFFVHAASSNGHVSNRLVANYDIPTIYEKLSDAGKSWRIYYGDVPQSLALGHLREPRNRRNYRKLGHFAEDAAAGALPDYTFIEPRYFDFLGWKANDQHPGNHVELGEHLIAEVYEALRSSPLWERCLLLVVYDEHGGLYDHVPPPWDGHPVPVRAPGGVPSHNPPFAFDRLGPRVPAIVVSPWVARGAVDHTIYEHASVPATVRVLFGLDGPLNERDADAATFDRLITGTLRTDAPERLPRPEAGDGMREMAARTLSEPTLADVTPEAVGQEAASGDLNDLQVQLLNLANSLDERPEMRAMAAARPIATEHEAAVQVRERVAAFLGSDD